MTFIFDFSRIPGGLVQSFPVSFNIEEQIARKDYASQWLTIINGTAEEAKKVDTTDLTAATVTVDHREDTAATRPHNCRRVHLNARNGKSRVTAQTGSDVTHHVTMVRLINLHHRHSNLRKGAVTMGTPNAAPVPHAPQQFGQGAPPGYTFQYSNCAGARKALLIGINYIGQKNQLRGCINDVRNLAAFLIERYNYKLEDMVILTDDQSDPVRQPTKANIIRAMGWLVQGARPNDSLFLHFSGHGGQTEDLDGDEDDGYDEVIYPVDFRVAGHIVDDDIHNMVVKPLVQGCRLTAIFDSCHSGTVMDLPYVYSTKGVLKEPNLAAEAGQGALSAISAYATGDIGGVISSVMGFANKALRGNDGHYRTIQTKTSPADVIMFSGSKDDQTSADAMIAQRATGAMSWAFITALRQNPHQQSYVQLLNSIRDVLATKYSQKPQLSCSHPLDTNILFVM
ncbi:caspase domain-containing protein [Seiridium cupressi]